MPGRIVLFGATGYTGELTARELAGRGERPVLAARNPQRLRALAAELGGLDCAVADVSRPETVRDLVGRGDVLVSTVGPFTRWGAPAVEAAIAAGAHYLDSTGETPFIRRVFEAWGPRAEAAGSALVTAMGYDWVPGNLAAALAVKDAGGHARRVEIGYFTTGPMTSDAMSGGTKASVAQVMLEPSFAWQGGRIVTERTGARGRTFMVGGRERPGVSAGSSEHFGVPQACAEVRDVDVYLGWFGGASDAMRLLSAGTTLACRVPGVRSGLQAAAGRLVRGSSGGPDEQARAGSGSHVVAEAKDGGGGVLARVELSGANGYDFTAAMLAWGAHQASVGRLRGTGALGPVAAFGLADLEQGVKASGLERIV